MEVLAPGQILFPEYQNRIYQRLAVHLLPQRSCHPEMSFDGIQSAFCLTQIDVIGRQGSLCDLHDIPSKWCCRYLPDKKVSMWRPLRSKD